MENKTVVITGANGNLGGAVTAHFLQLGYRVIATVMNESAKEAFAKNDNLSVEVLDLGNEESTNQFVLQMVEKYKQIDAALMLVGGFAAGNISVTGSADIDKQISLNFTTAFHLAKPLLAHMQGHGSGRLVFIGARPALDAQAGKAMLAYALSKSLLLKLAEFINEESRETDITASVVVPGTLDTPLNRKNMPDVNPSALVNPCNLAEILEFLVSEKGRALKETVVKVYGGL